MGYRMTPEQKKLARRRVRQRQIERFGRLGYYRRKVANAIGAFFAYLAAGVVILAGGAFVFLWIGAIVTFWVCVIAVGGDLLGLWDVVSFV